VTVSGAAGYSKPVDCSGALVSFSSVIPGAPI
jgi:hypothetical protein